MAFITDTRSNGLAFFDGVNAAVKSTQERFATYKVYRKTLNELDSLSNRELADLGIHRSAIKGIALEAAYGA